VTGFPVLSVMTWAPFVAALAVMFTARHRPLLVRWLSLAGATVSLVASLWVYVNYDQEAAGFQFREEWPLVPSLGITYLLAIDGISALMALLTSIIIFAGVFASWTVEERSQEFYALLLVLVTGVYGVFVSLDLFVFFLFYEIAVLPMYLLIGIWGSSGDVRPQGIFGWAFGRTGVGTKEYAAMKLTLYLLLGSAFILVGMLTLYVLGGRSFSLLELQQQQFDPAVQTWVFLAFYIGFGVLAGIWPLHTWSPDGHASAPTAVSMLHAGVLMKLGAYGVVRLGIGLLPQAAVEWAWLVGTIACINIVYGALSAMAQRDLKYVIAYSSVSHMGVVMLGAATLNENGLNGSVFQMFAHGIMTGLFFALVGLVYEKAHSREIFRMGGFGTMMPGIATAFTIAGLSSLGLPATAGFVAEFLTFLGAWQSAQPWWLFPAVIGAFLTSIYVLRVAGQIFWGAKSEDEHFQHLPDARGPEWAALGILVFVLVLFGVAPGIAIGPVRTSTIPLLERVDEARPPASASAAEFGR
jgi:NADH-quinone oxidoreductase subunit M